MRRSSGGSFTPGELDELDELLGSARAVVPMRDVLMGANDFDVVAVRHDVDDNEGSWQAALDFARWEHARGYRTTYFLLHSASYWCSPRFWQGVALIRSLGHEIGIHVNAIAQAIRTGRDPHLILREALALLRLHVPVVGSVAHGDELCGKYRFVNDEQFVECARPSFGAPDRQVGPVKLDPRPLGSFGIRYDSNRLPRRYYASDSGGVWNQPWAETVAQAEAADGQLHMLVHPDWWTEAF